ncbi:MAG: cytochrome c [Paracoccaceae bacterium]|nr:cytochrome c [Paracoccaceae bacterium]
MKTTRAFGFALAIALAAGGAWFHARPTLRSSTLAMDEIGSVTPVGVVMDVRPYSALSAAAATGKTYCEAVYVSCHGVNAAGQANIAPPLVHQIYEPSHHGDAAFLVAASNGVRAHHWPLGSMPPLGQKLTDSELQRENGIM